MALIAPDWNPRPGQLRTFSVVAGVFAAVIGLLVWHHATGSPASPPTASLVTWGIGGVILLLGLAAPKTVLPVYILLMAVSLPIGMVLSWVVLGIIYYLVMTPIGLFLRVRGMDPMHRRIDRSAASYWVPLPPPPAAERYFRQS